jgi:hypothetical protein
MIFDFVAYLMERLRPAPIFSNNISNPSNLNISTHEQINRHDGG